MILDFSGIGSVDAQTVGFAVACGLLSEETLSHLGRDSEKGYVGVAARAEMARRMYLNRDDDSAATVGAWLDDDGRWCEVSGWTWDAEQNTSY